MINDIKELIKELVNDLNKYAYEYYTLDNPSISDKEYDEKYDELTRLQKETGIILPNSPTLKVGGEILEGFKTHKHLNKLYSTNKAQTKEELKDFYNKIQSFTKVNNLPKPQYVLTKKYDGGSLNTTYTNGIKTVSATRGKGEIGEDVTKNADTIINLPKKIKNIDYGILEINGEVLMSKKALIEYNKTAKEPLKNVRNGATGAIRQLDTSECAKRKLFTYCYNLNYASEEFKFNTYVEQLEFMKKVGLPVDEYVICNTLEEIEKEINRIESIRDSLQYDIDGVVIRINDLETCKTLGYTEKFPRFNLAYKFEAEETTTKLLDVEFNVGRTGKITPRAILEPCELMGVTVKYATLNNMDDIQRKNVKIGGRVFIRRSNDVIPEIMGNANNEGEEVTMPTNCPVCGSKLIKDGVHYFCPNTLVCKAQLLKSIEHFCSKEAMDIEGLSIKTIEQFLENNIIQNIVDLYCKLEKEDIKKKIIKLPKFGIKKYTNLITSINKSKECDLSSFIYALGIPNVGKKTSKDICKYFNNDLDKIRNTTFDELIKISDIGDMVSRDVIQWFNNDRNNVMLNELLKYIEFKKEEKKEQVQQSLQGLTFVITGDVHIYKNRNEIKAKIEELGGVVTGSVSKKTNYLLNNDINSSSNKNKKAKELNIPIITEEEFEQMVK